MIDLTALRLEQANARQQVYLARKAGKIEKPGACSWCGKAGKLQAHHADYAEALSVEWLCASCHKALHIRLVSMLSDLKMARKAASNFSGKEANSAMKPERKAV
jgi:hypothetical protein